jgi:hypothetical protein
VKKQGATSSGSPRAYNRIRRAVHQWFLESRPAGRKAERYRPLFGETLTESRYG